MYLYWLELKKLLSAAAVWGFLAICLLFNIYWVINNAEDKYADFIGAASKDTGYRLGQSLNEKLSQFTVSDEQAQYWEQLKSDTYDIADVFDGYETEGIGESYIAAGGVMGSFAEDMRDKYSALQKVVDKKSATNESLTLYFASDTYNRHQQLFNGLTGWLLIEGILISAIMALLSVGYENSRRAEDVVYSTKKGRLILRPKIAATLSAGLGAYVLLALFTFLIYFCINNYGNIWGSSVSSAFNYRYDVIAGLRPFITWYSFSVLTYFLAMLGMSIGLIMCFSLMAFTIGVLIRNQYIGFIVFLAINAFFVALPMQLAQTLTIGLYARYYSMLSPVWLWLKHSIWFTDGDIDILWPHFETLGLGVSFFVITAFCILAIIYFRRKDLA